MPRQLAELEAAARQLGRRIKQGVPPGVGFVVVMYDYGPNGHMTFLSSGDRGDTMKMLRELLQKMAADS